MYSPSGCRCLGTEQVWYYQPVVYYQPQALYQALQFVQVATAIGSILVVAGEAVKAIRGKKER